MKNIKSKYLLVVVVTGLLLASCVGTGAGYNSGALGQFTLALSPNTTTLNVGEQLTLTTTLTGATNGTNQTPSNINIIFSFSQSGQPDSTQTCTITAPTTSPATTATNSCSVTYTSSQPGKVVIYVMPNITSSGRTFDPSSPTYIIKQLTIQ